MFGGLQPETDLFPGFFHAQVLKFFFLPGENGYTLPAGDHHELVVNQVLDPHELVVNRVLGPP